MNDEDEYKPRAIQISCCGFVGTADQRIVMTFPEATLEDFCENLKHFAISIGFHPDSVEEFIK